MNKGNIALMLALAVVALVLTMAIVAGVIMLMLWFEGQHGFEMTVLVALAVLIVGQLFNGGD